MTVNYLANVGTTTVQTLIGAVTTVAHALVGVALRAEAGSDSDVDFYSDNDAELAAHVTRRTATDTDRSAAAADQAGGITTAAAGSTNVTSEGSERVLAPHVTHTIRASNVSTTAVRPTSHTSIFSLLERCKELTSTYGTHQQYQVLFSVRPSARHLRHLARLTKSGLVLPVVSRSHVMAFTTEGVRKAQDQVESGHTRGKVVVAVSPTAGVRGGGLGIGPTNVLWEEAKAQ